MSEQSTHPLRDQALSLAGVSLHLYGKTEPRPGRKMGHLTALADTALINLKMDLDPVHSGSPLFNMKQEVVGMVLLEVHAKSVFPVEGSHHFAIPKLLLDNAMKAGKMDKIIRPVQNLSREPFILKSRNNIVLIEAR